MIVFLFGLPGVGKTYIAQLLQRTYGLCYWDGDNALTEEMKITVRNELPFSKEMTAQLTTNIISNITELKKSHQLLIVSQAMLRESDRQMFREQFSDIHFIYIRCDPEQTSQRIAQRADFVTVSYLEKITQAFEMHRKDAEAYPVIDNFRKTNEELIQEFEAILNCDPKLKRLPNFFTCVKNSEDKTLEIYRSEYCPLIKS